ncbi:MAG: sugar ABC transporter permease [Oscillospiraceae bacterium]|nr:sugar ABC transporter permease [Oscillospiraceae bacterium]
MDETYRGGGALSRFFRWLGKDLKEIGLSFAEGDWKTKLSFLIMGFGQLCRGQIVRGLSMLALEGGILFYFFDFGWGYLKDIVTLGTVETYKEGRRTVYGDNSFLILLYGLLTIVIVAALIFLWRVNVKQNREAEKRLKLGKRLPTNREDLASLFDKNFDKTLLALPVTGIFIFTVLPIIFMICIAFTNYDVTHQPPAKLFSWVGLSNFKELFGIGGEGFGNTFFYVLGWTLVWAFFATFLTYFLGMAVAIMINKKGIKLKKLWRTILVMTIAVPQFVSLLYVGKMFAADGLVNGLLLKWGWIQTAIPFWQNATYARILIILINLWIGIPYTMLIVTGLLMNIPAELYESARIDGANVFQTFRKITLPYMLFVTGPFLLTQFIGNLNNFNVIFLLNQGNPKSLSLAKNAGSTDLLVTWLYKMTINDSNYKIAAVIGIMVFLVTAVISLIVYNTMPSVKDEEGFQ